jgi:folate-binding protein YgfZ
MRDLPLAEEHARARARFADLAGWRVPVDYRDEPKEQRAVRQSAGVVDWSARGKVRVTGADRLEFLDGLLTNDLKPLAEGAGLYAATLDHRAHVHGDATVYHAGDHYLLETDPETREAILAYLQKLLVSEDVTLTDATAEFGLLGVFGPRSVEIVERISGRMPPIGPYDHLVANIADTRVRIARSPYFGGAGFELWIPFDGDLRAVWRSVTEAGATPFGSAAAEALRIEAGRPKFGVDMGEDTLALEARLEPAISMTKGCYVGQEIVSRAVHQGHMNRLLVGLELEADEPPAHDTPVLRGLTTVGHVTSAAKSVWRGKVLALGYVRRETSDPGTELAVGGSPARVAALPFYR